MVGFRFEVRRGISRSPAGVSQRTEPEASPRKEKRRAPSRRWYVLRYEGSNRLVARHGHAEPRTGVRPVIPHRPMLHTAVVPKRHRVLLPTKPALKQRIFRMAIQVCEHRRTLVPRHADQSPGKSAVDIERLAPCHRMRADHGVFGPRVDRFIGDSKVCISSTVGFFALCVLLADRLYAAGWVRMQSSGSSKRGRARSARAAPPRTTDT